MLFVPAPPPAQTGSTATPAADHASAPQASPIDIFASAAQIPTLRRHERMHIHSAALNVRAGHDVTVTGALLPRLARRHVALQVLNGRRWQTVARDTTGASGRFRLHYQEHRAGSWPAQVRFAGGPYATSVTRRLGKVNSFRPALASWYGGGGGLACGGQLTSSTMGVANKTLPCGTWVTLRYGGRSVRVQVIDRGPYVAGREYDLTEATKRALGFEGVGVVWTTH